MRTIGNPHPTRTVQRAFMFVDYENLFDYIKHNDDQQSNPETKAGGLLSAVSQYMEGMRVSLVSSVAYADFATIGAVGQQIQQSLYLAGVEPRFVPASLQSNASEIQICVDIMNTLQAQRDITVIILVTGDRLYLPLMKFCQQSGFRGVVITFQSPDPTRSGEHSDLFIDANTLLDQTSHPAHLHAGEPVRPAPDQSHRTAEAGPPPEKIAEVTNETSLLALEVIDRFFGQYEEVYLTPLLRKLSEALGGEDDPKALVGDLNEAGAVWLEKRRGYPYDYTVLLINHDHPNVLALQAGEQSYNDDEYTDFDEEQNSLYYNQDLGNSRENSSNSPIVR